MKLYCDPISTTSRGPLLFDAEHDLDIEVVKVSLLDDEHTRPSFLTMNPNGKVPVLVDGDLTIGEGSAILKYMAEVAGSPTYPTERKARARVNSMMDWFNTGLSMDLNYQYVYPQLFPQFRPDHPLVAEEMLRRGHSNAVRWLGVLDRSYLAAGGPYVCGADLTIADYLGASYIGLADGIDFDLSPWPNIEAWMQRMKSRPSWGSVNAAFYGLVAFLKASQRQAS